jgi:hypothetical protein
MLKGLAEYAGLEHRVQTVAEQGGVRFVDDSKGTNVGATQAALAGLGGELANGARIVLIAGGDGKGQDFSPLASAVARHCRAVMLIGRDAPVMRQALGGAGVEMRQCESLEAAVAAARDAAQPGDVVLLSPACASFDMFRNYAHRAQVFIEAVRTLGRAPDAGADMDAAPQPEPEIAPPLEAAPEVAIPVESAPEIAMAVEAALVGEVPSQVTEPAIDAHEPVEADWWPFDMPAVVAAQGAEGSHA